MTGAVTGAAVGVGARVWMRLLTTENPEFTWGGTMFIVAWFAGSGLVLGFAIGARRRGWRGRPMALARTLGCLVTLVLAVGPGAPMAPTMLFGGLAVARRSWWRGFRLALGVAALAPVALVHADLAQVSISRLLAALVVCVAVYGCVVVALAQCYAGGRGTEDAAE